MKKNITTIFILASFLIGNITLAQENINTEYLEWAEDGKLDEVKKYLAKGADINFLNEDGMCAGEYAIWNIDEDGGAMITYLLDHGLKVDYSNPDGHGLLHIAAAYEGSAIFKKLIDKGIGIDDFTDNGETAVFIAAESDDFEAVKVLVSLGANVQLANQEGETIVNEYDLEKENLWNELISFNLSKEQLNQLLIKAVYDLESLDKVKQMVEKGADINVKNEDEIPLIHLAAQLDETSILAFLIEKGSNVNALDEEGYNALWEAESLEGMAMLLDKGIDANQIVDGELLISQSIYFS